MEAISVGDQDTKKRTVRAQRFSTDGVILTSAIEAWERRARSVMDIIPGAFLHANCDDGDTYMLLRSKAVQRAR